MKYLIILVAFIVSIGVSIKVTSDMTQEIVGALFIQGIINDHKVHKKLVVALESQDTEAVKKIASGMLSYNADLLETLTSSLEKGKYSFVTKKEVSEGREYLLQIKESQLEQK